MEFLSEKQRKIYKTTLKMALPSIAESFFVALAGLVDSLMVSSLGSNAVAAVGITTQPKFACLSLYIALNVAVSALVARRYGEKNRKGANSIVFTAIVFIFISALILSNIFVFTAPQIIRFCGSTPETHSDAVLYFKIVVGGMIFNCLQMGINSAQRGAGNTKITMRTNITSNSVNIVFNYLLINGRFGFPALGIKGAALATVLGTVVSSFMSIISIMGKKSFISIKYIINEKIKPSFTAFKMIVKIGYSVFLEQILVRIGFMLTAIMAAHMGNNAMAAHQVCMNLLGISFSFGDGLQVAAVALIGKSLGEKNPELAKKYGSACQLFGGIISVVFAALFMFWSKGFMKLFFREKEIIETGVLLIYITIPTILFQIRQVIYTGCLRGAGDTFYTALISTIGVTFVRTAFSYAFGYALGFGIEGIWIGILADQMSRCIFAFLRFRQGKWVNIKI